jgi:hypothetical protein
MMHDQIRSVAFHAIPSTELNTLARAKAKNREKEKQNPVFVSLRHTLEAHFCQSGQCSFVFHEFLVMKHEP